MCAYASNSPRFFFSAAIVKVGLYGWVAVCLHYGPALTFQARSAGQLPQIHPLSVIGLIVVERLAPILSGCGSATPAGAPPKGTNLSRTAETHRLIGG